MKNKLFLLMLVIFFPAIPMPAQELTPVQPKDTSLFLVQLYSPELIFAEPFHLSSLSNSTTQNAPKSFYLPAELSLQPFSWTVEPKIDLASPWKLQFAEENKYRTLSMILGSVSTGGAVYIAYRHVKKYGFW